MSISILHVEMGTNLYGGALQVRYLIRGLAARNYRNLLVCDHAGAIRHEAAGDAHAVYGIREAGDFNWRLVSRLRSIIARERPDIVHLHSRRGAELLGAVAARLERVPVVLSRRVDSRENRAWARAKYRLYDRVIAISTAIRELLLASGVEPGKVAFVPSAIDPAEYCGTADSDWFRREFSIPADACVIAMVGQLIGRKGHRYLFDVLPDVLREHPRARVILFGKGRLEAKLRRQVRVLGLESHVLFAGYREDLHRILPAIDLLVHPAEKEGLGVALLQAACAGVPILATRVGGIPDAVRDGYNGLLVPPRDRHALACELKRLLADGNLRQDMGWRGRSLVRRQFSVQQMVDGNLEVYHSLRSLRASHAEVRKAS